MSSLTPTQATVSGRRPQARSEETRRALVAAALAEFARQGFDGASTRTIAEAAGSHQPQINYHFGSKEALWRAAVDHLFSQLDELLAEHTARLGAGATPRDQFATFLRALVYTVADLPELNRIMSREATIESARLTWIVDEHIRPRFAELVAAWRSLQGDQGVSQIDEAVFYYSLIGVTSLAYVNAPEAHLLGIDTSSSAFVSAHADAVARMFLPWSP